MTYQRRLDDVLFCCELKHETEKALLVFDGENEIWLPRSQIKNMRRIRDNDYELVLQQWIAKGKGII
jgi:hypothetical protein